MERNPNAVWWDRLTGGSVLVQVTSHKHGGKQLQTADTQKQNLPDCWLCVTSTFPADGVCGVDLKLRLSRVCLGGCCRGEPVSPGAGGSFRRSSFMFHGGYPSIYRRGVGDGLLSAPSSLRYLQLILM